MLPNSLFGGISQYYQDLNQFGNANQQDQFGNASQQDQLASQFCNASQQNQMLSQSYYADQSFLAKKREHDELVYNQRRRMVIDNLRRDNEGVKELWQNVVDAQAKYEMMLELIITEEMIKNV